MPIVTSNIIENAEQSDGRSHVREEHIDHLGRSHFVSYTADVEASPTAEMASRVDALNSQLIEDEKERLLHHVFAGTSIQAFAFTDLTLQDGGRFLARHMHGMEDPRPARGYAQQVVNAGVVTIASVLGISSGSADKLYDWAQGVIDSVDGADSAKANVASALVEIGGEV